MTLSETVPTTNGNEGEEEEEVGDGTLQQVFPMEEDTVVSPPLARRLRSAKKPKRARSHSEETDEQQVQLQPNLQSQLPSKRLKLDNENENENQNGNADSNGKEGNNDNYYDDHDIKNQNNDNGYDDSMHEELEDPDNHDTGSEESEEDHQMDDNNERPLQLHTNDTTGTDVLLELVEMEQLQTEQQPSDMEQPETDQPPAPVECVAHNNNTKQLERIETLRMPCQHTPGKIISTTTRPPIIEPPRQKLILNHHIVENSPIMGNSPVATKITNEQLQQQHLQHIHTDLNDIMVLPVPQDEDNFDWSQQPTSRIKKTFQLVHQLIMNMIVPASASASASINLDEGVEHHETETSHHWRKWNMWCIFALALQFLYFYPILHLENRPAFLSSAVSFVIAVKQMMGSPVVHVEDVTKVQLPDETVVITKILPHVIDPDLHIAQLQDIDSLVNQRHILDQSVSDLANVRLDLEEEIQSVRSILDDHQSSLRKWELALNQADRQMDILIGMASTNDTTNMPVVLTRVGMAVSRVGGYIPTKLINANDVPMWILPSPATKCDAPSQASNHQDPLVSQTQLDDIREQLSQMTRTHVAQMMQDESLQTTAKSWMRERITTIAKEHAVITTAETPTTSTTRENVDVNQGGLSKDQVKEVVLDALERKWADATGEIDYASLYAGAKIIRHGPRATSPSLTDTLPLVNRLLVNTKLRFYGHGPEAALTPTTTRSESAGLGQCWSFTNISNSKIRRWKNAHRTDNMNGKYGTLSIQLASPIRIGSVIIEHPLSFSPNTSLHMFRLFGYLNVDGTGRAFALGEFAFESEQSNTQVFSIAEMNDVSFHSITLAIDSNHGSNYTCLYRFRLHAR